ncbi:MULTISPECIES: phosphatase PAP2 family protein [Streptomyces]|jgi:undecaprenyl-diphosphatase|uniref:Integral membrane protein n=3 Tax=Streptomyces griseoaurantiacus TaxID=68213 RepID=F3NEJ1_9ACTN|nr:MULTISPECIES: phosphatase PAP2 family protein [Streptomyces]EGG48260.1 integral membrane protein [Streptomyces griseoaurantiacus M045]MBA5226001.1 phosphatase PAP2 family protein [Streptomyces griseoaurantiacus]MCF0090316.1 Undecaprenyl-diphosphatase BcrC [Streptomyces sp. MH192]MCF0102570.1 Undecaprenyl-diphosphatase BcrC [Streptomyces sp. MH191]MDX3087609.1 phosphatase PAP2 family protein [Streptomyces sp. ME12-02E]
MAGLAESSGSNPDVELLYDINGLAKDAPHWFDRLMEFIGEYGLLFAMMLLVLWCWWGVRRRGGEGAAPSVAALVWAPLAAGVAVLVNVPIRGFVERPRPFVDHDGLEVLVDGKDDFSFVSDHATLTMAIAVGLFVANRRFGLIGIGLALLEGFCRVYMGVHYPTDVVGGFALGTAVALLLSPVAMALLTPVVRAVEKSPRLGWLVRDRRRADMASGTSADVPGERDLAA